MPKKGAAQAKNALISWLEDYCRQNSAFKRNLFILYKQKKFKHIAAAIKKDYVSQDETNYLDNSQTVLGIMKHLESFDFSKKSGGENDTTANSSSSSSSSKTPAAKRGRSEAAVLSASADSKKGSKKVKVVEEGGEEFNEDEMTSFLDRADDEMMTRFYAEEGAEVEEDEDEVFVQETLYDLQEQDQGEESFKYGDFFKA